MEPPKAPETLVAQAKKRDRGRSINSGDKILSIIQRNLLQGIQPLLKLLNETDDRNVRDPLSAGLAMLEAATHRLSKFRQSYYDEFLGNGYESLKDKMLSVKSLHGDDYIQDIQSCTKSKKAIETAFSSSTKMKHNSERNSTHKDHSSYRSYGYDAADRRFRFRKQRGRGNYIQTPDVPTLIQEVPTHILERTELNHSNQQPSFPLEKLGGTPWVLSVIRQGLEFPSRFPSSNKYEFKLITSLRSLFFSPTFSRSTRKMGISD